MSTRVATEQLQAKVCCKNVDFETLADETTSGFEYCLEKVPVKTTSTSRLEKLKPLKN